MIIMIGGAPATGKSTLLKNIIISELGSAENVEPMKLFPCQKHGKVLVVGRYPAGETYGGTDRMSYGAISGFKAFIDKVSKEYDHIILEGDRFFRGPDVEWLLNNHESKVYVLKVSLDEELRRHKERGDTQDPKWLKGRRRVIENILTNMWLMGVIEVRVNDTPEDSKSIQEEISANLQD
jgi:hypothetical protein